MNNPFLLDWLFDKDNPPNNKDNPPNVKMSFHSDPKTVSFVSTPATDQLSFHSNTTRIKNNDVIMKIAMDNISFIKSTLDNNDSPNNKDNFPNNKKFSIPYAKIGKFVKKVER